MERTTEKFDSWKYYTHRENDDYEFKKLFKKARYVSSEERMVLIILNTPRKIRSYSVHIESITIKVRPLS